MNQVASAACVVAVIAVLGALPGCSAPPVGAAEEGAAGGNGKNGEPAVGVDAFTPQRVELKNTTTQPATVHALHEAQMFAKVSGYLSDLRADIGQAVKAGDVLAVIEVPELAQQRQTKLASIKRLQADEQHAEAEVSVAEATITSYEARLEKARADLGKATAQLNAAKVELDRIRDLVGQKAVADKLLDETQARYEAAEAERVAAQAAIKASEKERDLSKARAEAAKAMRDMGRAMTDVARSELEELDVLLRYTQLTAPFDGVVTARNTDPGDLVRNAQNGAGKGDPPLFAVVQVDKVRVRVAVPERDAPLVDIGDTARVTLQALPGEVFEGQVARLAGVLDEKTRTMIAEIDLPNDERKLLPGMFGEATIVLESSPERIVLPSNSVRYDEHGNSYVYTVNRELAVEIVEVTTGLDDGKQIEITSGLNGSERVVGPVLRRLTEGQKVRVNSS